MGINEKQIYKDALDLWGIDLQYNMVFEEAGELITALSQFLRGRITKYEVATEIADVRIMLKQLEYILDIKTLCASMEEKKLERLSNIIVAGRIAQEEREAAKKQGIT